MEGLRDAPDGIFSCAVESNSTTTAAVKEQPGYS